MNQIVLAVALPLLGAFLLPLLMRVSRLVGALAGPLVLIAVAMVLGNAWQGYSVPTSIAIGGFLPPLGITFYIDGLALLFAGAVPVMTLLLWPWGKGEDAVRIQSLTLLLAGAGAGLALSGDLFNLYVFYELAAVASYGLASARGTGAGFAAALRYLLISALGSLLALVGIALIYFKVGTVNLADLAELRGLLADPVGLAAFALLMLGFGVKAEIFPLNTWVPEVYAATTSRIAGLLAGLVSKLALLVVVRLLILVFPDDAARQMLLILGILGVLAGELAAWRAQDMARMLGWSSIGQLGLVFIAFSLPGQTGLVAGIALALHHLLVKPALFLLATRWGGALDHLSGAAKVSPLGALLFTLFALSLIGVPPLPGFWAKFLLLSGLAAGGDGLQMIALGSILAMTVIEANYLFRLVTRMYSPTMHTSPARHGVLDITTATLFGLALLAAVVQIGPLWDGLNGVAAQAADVSTYIATVAPSVEVRP